MGFSWFRSSGSEHPSSSQEHVRNEHNGQHDGSHNHHHQHHQQQQHSTADRNFGLKVPAFTSHYPAHREARIRRLFAELDPAGTGFLDARAIEQHYDIRRSDLNLSQQTVDNKDTATVSDNAHVTAKATTAAATAATAGKDGLSSSVSTDVVPPSRRYAMQLLKVSDTNSDGRVDYDEFRAFVLAKERQLWHIFQDIDTSHDHSLQLEELRHSLDQVNQRRGLRLQLHTANGKDSSSGSSSGSDSDGRFLDAGLHGLNPEDALHILHVLDRDGDGHVDFEEWRDALLLLPVTDTTVDNVFGYLRGTIDRPVGPDGEVAVPAEPISPGTTWAQAAKLFIAGGVAGAVSRTATAPLDRMRVYLQTVARNTTPQQQQPQRLSIPMVAQELYRAGGLKTFWTGNGLNVLKIAPESAIKFVSYEYGKYILLTLKRDQADITLSPVGRFMAGGIAGVISQSAIYPLETMKTRIIQSANGTKWRQNSIVNVARDMYRTGGGKAFFRGLVPSLLGIFPLAAIDLSLFDALKRWYITRQATQASSLSAGQTDIDHEPGPLTTLVFGMISGSVGATTVYPLAVVRTRMQAQGTVAHPHKYSSMRECFSVSFQRHGYKGFYAGLSASLIKVVPAVGITYVVYEWSKRKLGVNQSR
ncbi:mitochondrial carrier [Ramicandelaber brevisporus]|nr:mitochondrial carrier [Ramicandelaber brevisporus]